MPNWDTFDCEIDSILPTSNWKRYILRILTGEKAHLYSFIDEEDLDDTILIKWSL